MKANRDSHYTTSDDLLICKFIKLINTSRVLETTQPIGSKSLIMKAVESSNNEFNDTHI